MRRPTGFIRHWGVEILSSVAVLRKVWYSVGGAASNGRRLALCYRGRNFLPPVLLKGGLPYGDLFRPVPIHVGFDRPCRCSRCRMEHKKEVTAVTIPPIGDYFNDLVGG